MPRIVRSALLVCVALAPAARAQGTAPRTLTLTEALALAHDGNAGLRVVRLQVEQAARESRVGFSYYLPRLSTQGAFLGSNNTRGILLPGGSLGNIPGLGSFPAASTSIPQGGPNIAFALTTAQQPLTQFFKIREGLAVNRADEDVSRANLRRTEQAVSLGVIKAYAGVLIASKRRDVARERVRTASMRTTTQAVAVQAGMATNAADIEARLRALQARQESLESESEYADLSYALADAIGLPGSTALALVAPAPDSTGLDALDSYVAAALRSNPDILEAEATTAKATHGVAAAKASYIPDLGIFAGHFYQGSFPFLPRNTLVFGAIGSLTLLDFGARSNTVAERNAQLGAAGENLVRVTGRVRGEVEAAYRKVANAGEMVSVAREASALRAEALRLRVVQGDAGYGIPAEQSQATADQLQADLDLLRAEMGYRVARAELDQAAGRLAP